MRNIASIVCGIALLAVIPGCDLLAPSPATVMRNVAAAENDLTEALKAVRDAESAKAAIPNIESKYAVLGAAMSKFGELLRSERKDGMDDSGAAQAVQDIQAASARLKSEHDRINAIPGLPPEFWKTITLRQIEFGLLGLEAAPADKVPQVAQSIQFLKDMQSLYQTYPFEEVLDVELLNVRSDLVKTACDRILQLAPNATIYQTKLDCGFRLVFGPVKDYNAFVSGIDFGNVLVRNDTSRRMKIAIDPEKLDPGIKAQREEAERMAKENEERARESAESSRREREEAERKAKEFAANGGVRISPFTTINANDPDYFDKLANILTSGDVFEAEKAADALLKHTPSEVASAETKKKIARGFKHLAEDESSFAKKKAIRGLVVWGGKYSGPILLRMLSERHFFEEAEVIVALGEIKYSPAAMAIAARLGDFHHHQSAFNALQELGPAAEDALMRVALSEDPKTCLSAVDLLAESGTEKCLPLLSKGFSSRNLQVREACKDAIRKVKARMKEAKDKAKDDGDES